MFYNDLFTKAINLFDQGDFASADCLLRQILQTSPDNPEVLNLLGLTAQAQGLHKEALPYFSAAIRQEPNKAAFYYNLAFSLKAIGEYADALNNFFHVMSLSPQIKETYNEIACIYEAINNLPQARDYWQKALSLDPAYSTAEINLANSYRLDNPNQAEQLLQDLIKRFPDETLGFYDLAWLKYQQNQPQTALNFAKKAETLSPSSDAIKYLLGLIYLQLNQDDKALAILSSAEELNPNSPQTKLCLADIFSRLSRFDEAEARYKRVIELDAKNFAAHNNYAEMLYRQHRLPEALEEYRQAIILHPDAAETSNNLGIVLKDLGQYEQASDLFFNALRCNPELVEASINLAEVLMLFSQQNENEALKIAQYWLKSFPSNEFARNLCAALQGEPIENNQDFIEKLFDNFALNYELVMQNLDYAAPLAIRRIAGDIEGRIADIGCGSGLVGVAVKTPRNQLIGVDLSAKMLELAAAKHVYTELIKSDALAFLHQRSDFDWIIAADVLGYISSPEDLVSLCRGKNIIFTIEKSDTSNSYQIQKNGRFKHNPLYIEQLLKKYGFQDIVIKDIVLRTENSSPVQGCIFKAAPSQPK